MDVTLEQMVYAGIHIGHLTRYRNPRIADYVYGVQAGNHMINLVATRRELQRARKLRITIREQGRPILFVGTKDSARQAIEDSAKACDSFFVTGRWLGGSLTNWSTIQTSLQRLNRLERERKISSLQARLDRRLRGLKGMQSLPGLVIIVGQTVELTAIYECRNLKIPVICRLDTDCDPTLVDIGVPINDDSTSSIRLFLEVLLSGVQEGHRSRLRSHRTKRESEVLIKSDVLSVLF